MRPALLPGACRVVAIVDEERCSACGTCADVCFEGAISVTESAAIDPQRCIGCGVCVLQCPSEALSLGQQTTAVVRGAARG